MVRQQERRHLRPAGLSGGYAGRQQLRHRIREPGGNAAAAVGRWRVVLVVWQWAKNGGASDDLYGRRLWTAGRPADDKPAFTLMEAAGDQESPAVAGDGTGGWLVAWQDECEAYQERSGWYRNGDWDIYGTTLRDERRVIAYEYDGLYRLTEASYSTGELFQYDYDPVGNREAMTVTTPLGGTDVTTYTYDAANRLTNRVVSDGRSYTYTWSSRGEVSRLARGNVPAWSPDGQLLAYAVQTTSALDVECRQQIWIRVIATGEDRRVFDTDCADGFFQDLTWSPDQNLLAYSKEIASTNSDESRMGVYALGLDTGKIELVSRATGWADSPGFSPDSYGIMYRDNSAVGKDYLEVLNLRMGQCHRVALSLPRFFEVELSLDGSKIAFTQHRGIVVGDAQAVLGSTFWTTGEPCDDP
jgi:YD repeat-containing protein